MAYSHPFPGSASASGSSSSSGLHFLNSPFGDTTYTKVFVGGLAWETRSETLRHYFEQFGEILEAVVITDKNTGRSKGYGFVTFRDPESARRACTDPSPVIDGRRANCNLASLKRSWPAPPYAMRSVGPFPGGMPFPRGAYPGNPSYRQYVPYNLQQGFVYPQFGFSYGSEYAYSQNVYDPYTGQQYIQLIPGTINPSVYPFGQTTQHLPSGHGYTASPGYALPGHQLVPLSGPNLNSAAATPLPPFPASYRPVVAPPVPSRPLFMISDPSPQFSQFNGSDQTTS